MAFLHPGLFIAALACVAIPILIHLLLRRRRKPIAWGAMRFLLEAYQKQRSKLRVQQLILLATRCLIVLLVGSAIAGPILEEAGLLGGGAGRDVYILVDNSVASSLREGGVGGEAVIEKHKRTAREIIDALGPGDRAGVVALGAPSRAIVVPASSDLSAVLDVIDSLEPTDSAADIAGALRALTQRSETGEDTSPGAADDAQRTVAILVSEFREGSADVSSALDAGEIELFATPPSERRVDNTQITGVSPLRAVVLTGTGGLSRDEQLRVTLRRDGPSVDEPAVSALSVSFVGLDGQRIGRESRAEVRWDAGQQEKTVTASVDASVSGEAGATGVTSGAIVARIDRDTLDADNTFRLPLAVLESLRVGIVARPRFERGLRADEFGPPEWLSLALRPAASAPIDVIEIEPTTIDTPTLASVDALLLPAPDVIPEGRWQSIRRFADEGGLVIVFPSTRSTVQLWSDAFTSSMALPWRFDREPTDRTESPVSISGETTNTSLLGPIASEINDLLAPVRVTSTLNAAAPGGDGDVVFRLGTGEPWMLAATPGADEATARPGEQRAASRGLVVYIASAMDLAWTDLPARPLMVPLFQELVRQGFGTSSGTRITVAGRPVLAPSRSTRVRSVDDAVAFDASVADSGLLTEPVRQAGLYEARDATARSRGLIGANADAQGARTSPRTQDALGPWLSSASQTPDAGVTWLDPDAPAGALRRAATGSTIGWPLLVLGLCLALIETVMARFFSHAFRDPGRGRAQSEGVA